MLNALILQTQREDQESSNNLKYSHFSPKTIS